MDREKNRFIIPDFKSGVQRKSMEAVSDRRFRVGITGMWHGAGCTTVTLMLAEEFAALCEEEPVSVIAFGDTSYYDALGMEARFKEGGFVPVEHLDEDGNAGADGFNEEEGICWAVSSPLTEGVSLPEERKAAILSRIPGAVQLWDLGAEKIPEDRSWYVSQIDALVFVMDPLPTSLLKGYENFLRWKEEDVPTVYVINRMNEGVDFRQVQDLLHIRKPVVIPFLNPAFLYRAEYACINPYRDEDVRGTVIEPVGRLADILLGIRESRMDERQ